MMHFGGKDVKKHASKALKRLRAIADAREAWRETRVHQALAYPDLRVPITRKLMRLSGNTCMICGRQTHVAGDQLCMELHLYYMLDEKEKKREIEDKSRRETRHRITLAPTVLASQAAGLGSPSGGSPRRKSSVVRASATSSSGAHPTSTLPSLAEGGNEQASGGAPRTRLGVQLVAKQWAEADKAGLRLLHRQPQRPQVSLIGGPHVLLSYSDRVVGGADNADERAGERHVHHAVDARVESEEAAGAAGPQGADRGRDAAHPRVVAVRLAQGQRALDRR